MFSQSKGYFFLPAMVLTVTLSHSLKAQTHSGSAQKSDSDFIYSDDNLRHSSQRKNAQSIPSNLKGFGSRCTLIFARHGSRPSGVDNLDDMGVQQAHNLARSLQDFERNYQPIDTILHSNLKRSKQTAAPFKTMRHDINEPSLDIQKTLRECDTSETRNGTCRQKAKDLVAKIKLDYCKKNALGKPSKIFITGHGSLGLEMIYAMTGKKVSHPDFAEPYVLTTDDGDNYKLLYSP